jgi:hypothetical protein
MEHLDLRERSKRRMESSTICVLNYQGDEMDGTRSTCGEMKNANEIRVRKPKGKRPLGKTRHRWK